MATWNELLRRARDERRLSQEGLARLAAVSVETLSLYERGHSTPERATLLRLARALRLDRGAINAILRGAGREPVPTGRLAQFEAERRGLQYLQHEVEAYAWPCLVVNNRMEIICWNEPAHRVAELDFLRDLPTLAERNLFRIAVTPHFEQRLLNWDKVVGEMISTLKGEGAELGDPEEGPLYFAALVQDLARARPDLFPRIFELWTRAAPRADGHRVTFVIEWRLGDGTRLNFNFMISGWTDFDAAWALDWHPADAQTWSWLHEHAALPPASLIPKTPGGSRRARQQPLNSAVPAQAPWHSLLRQGREGTRLGRRELAALAGTSIHTLYSYETGKRRPSRDAVLRLAWAMELDGATTNLILDDLSLEPEPSDWARVLTGLAPRMRQWQSADPEGEARRSRERLPELIAGHPWPCLVLNAQCEPIAANAAAQRVLGSAAPIGLAEAVRRNLVDWLLSPEFRAHNVDWEEVVTALLPGGFKQAVARAGTRQRASAPFEALLARLRRDEPEALRRLQELWENAPLVALGERVTVPLIWQSDDGAILSFHCIVSHWSPYANLWALDLHPADATTWGFLSDAG